MKYVETVEELETVYGVAVAASLSKVADHLTQEYGRWVAASKFCIVSTVGPEGTDGTPRGDDGPVVAIQDAHTVLLPDWAGNNRCDSLRNIIRDERVSLMFMVQGSNNVVRINGRAKITMDEGLCRQFDRKGMMPRSVVVIAIDEVYFQCAKALMRSRLWGDLPDISDLPTAGDLVKSMTNGEFGGAEYDAAYEERAKKQFWTRVYE
ncbi:MAG: PPOX class probable FMN-dependent enzyme [Paracoccaceae bacterium]|jgi:PPOX class probable FMN-dependent enzyme